MPRRSRHDLGRLPLPLRQETNRDDPFSFPLVPKLRLGTDVPKLRLGTHFPKLRFANASPPIRSPGVLAGLKLQACTFLLGIGGRYNTLRASTPLSPRTKWPN